MKKKLVLACTMLCSLLMWAQSYPEKMWIVGDATPGGMNLNQDANLMTKLSDGVYQWKGHLNESSLKFLCSPSEWIPSYGPAVNGTALAGGQYALVLRNDYSEETDHKFVVEGGASANYCLTLDLTGSEPTLTIGYNSESGHYIYFHNSGSVWNHVYLRIGRNDHVHTRPFTRLGESDWWQCETPDYDNYDFFTIIDNSDETAPVSAYPANSNRLYEEKKDLYQNRWFTLTDGPHAEGNHYYWNNTSAVTPQIVLINEYAGHTIYFDNSVTQWEQPYFRIGRSQATDLGDYASARPFIQLDGTDIWYIDTEDWENAEVWTITNFGGNTGDVCVYELPADAERLHYYHDHIGVSKFVVAISPRGGTGPYYWNADVTNAYSRDVTSGKYGTICLPKGAFVYSGAEMYRLVDKTANNDIVIEQIAYMNAGDPYIFLATSSKLMVIMEGEEQTAHAINGLHGNIEEENMPLQPDGDKLFILNNNQIWKVDVEAIIPSNRAYIDMSEINPLPPLAGMKRRVINANAPAIVTDVENAAERHNGARKVLDNGHLRIIRDGNIYNALGQTVK